MSQLYTSHESIDSETLRKFMGTIILIGKFSPTSSVLEGPIEMVGGNLSTNAVEISFPRLETSRRLALPAPQNMKDGMDILQNPQVFTDPQNEIGRLKDFRDYAGFAEDTMPGDLNELSDWVTNHEQQIDENNPVVCEEFQQRINSFVEKHSSVAASIDVMAEPCVLVKELQPIINLGMKAKADWKICTLVETANQELSSIEAEMIVNGETLSDDFSDFVEATNSLRALTDLGGDALPRCFLFNTRNVAELLSKGRGLLIEAFQRLKLPYFDVLLLNQVTGSTTPLITLGEDLERHFRGSVWATIGGITSEAQAIKFATANPNKGTSGAGAVFSYLGGSSYKGYPFSVASAVLGNQYRLDFKEDGGQLTCNWGPQASRNLSGVEDALTEDWFEATYKHLAETAGINCLTRHSNGVLSPYSGRTMSNLADYRMINASRAATMIEGFMLTWLAENAPSQPNTAEKMRALCERAEDLYLGRFQGHDAYLTGSLIPIASSESTQARLVLSIKTADPIEQVVLIRLPGK